VIHSYLEYYSHPTIKNAKRLWESIREYDYHEPLDDLIAARKVIKPKLHLADRYLFSNGTVGKTRAYLIGPHADFWIKQIEDFVKYRTTRYINILDLLSFNHHKIARMPEPITDDSYYYIAAADYRQIDKFIQELARLGNYGFNAAPNTWLYLLSLPAFREFLSSRQIICLSTGWDGFYKQPPTNIHMNDNMVNWTTGMNFYTCQYGTRHYLQTFAIAPEGIVNLLNLACQPVLPVDDLMQISPVVKRCQCGRNFREISYFPHYIWLPKSSDGEIIYDLQLADHFKASYLNLQFIQIGQTIDVLYISNSNNDLLEHDQNIITTFFESHGLETVFKRDKYRSINRKYHVFLRIAAPTTYKSWNLVCTNSQPSSQPTI